MASEVASAPLKRRYVCFHCTRKPICAVSLREGRNRQEQGGGGGLTTMQMRSMTADSTIYSLPHGVVSRVLSDRAAPALGTMRKAS